MRKWRNGTYLSLGGVLTDLTQGQAVYTGVKIDVPFKGGHYHYWDSRFSRWWYRLQRWRKSQR